MNLQRSAEQHNYWYYKIIPILKKSLIDGKSIFFPGQGDPFKAVIPKKALKLRFSIEIECAWTPFKHKNTNFNEALSQNDLVFIEKAPKTYYKVV